MQEREVPKEGQAKFYELIKGLVGSIGMTYEDQSDLIEVLRKIESKLWYLSEARDYMQKNPMVKDRLVEEENRLVTKHQEERNKKNRNEQDQRRKMKEQKQLEKKKKKEEQIVNALLRKEVIRSKKRDLKPSETKKEEVDRDELDRRKYLKDLNIFGD